MQNAFAAIGIDLKTIRHGRPTCPQCGHKGTLWVDLVGGGYHCHSASCGFSGNVNSHVSTNPSRPKPSLEDMARQEAERQRTQDTNRERAARLARETWATLSLSGESAYLTKKKIPPIGIRFGRDRHSPFIAIPMLDVDGQWRGLQKLFDRKFDDGNDRLFGKGTNTKAAMHVIGELSDSAVIAITEGFANSASLSQADPSIVAVTAFSAGNLAPVALAIRAKYPNARIVLVADNDIRQPDAKHQKNDGVVCATEAALAVGGWLAVPELAGRKCDISDIWIEQGAAGVLACLQSARPAVEAAPAVTPLPELPTAIEAAKVLRKTLKDFFAAPGRVSLGIKAAAGCGKTTVALKLALESGSEGADRALIEALDSGMLSPVAPDSPDSGSASPEPKELPELPESHRPPVYPKISARGATQRIQRLADDVYAHPRNADGTARVVVVRSSTGIGKTEVVMNVARNAPVKTLWLTPTHNLADEAEQRFDELDKAARAVERGNLIQFQPHTAAAMRGRGAKAHESKADAPLFMCEKPKSLRAVKDKKLSLYTKSLLCKTKDAAGIEVKCEFLQQGTCRYYKQMRDPAKVRVLAHNYLTTPTAELVSSHINEVNYLTGQCPVIVIDESPVASLKRECRWVDDDKKAAGPLSAWMKDADLMRVAGAILHGVAISVDERAGLLERITTALGAMDDTPPATRPSDCDEAIAAAIDGFHPATDPVLKGMFLAAQRWLSGHTNTLWKGQRDGKPALFSRWYARPTMDSPILILDASADEAIYRALFGEKVEFHGFDTPMAAGVNVTQVSDNTFYQGKLDATKALKKGQMDTDRARRAHGLQARLAAFLMLAGAEQGQAGIVSYKGALDGDKENQIPGILDLIDVPALHYGNLVGMDTLKTLPLLIVAGRIEPDALETEADARALWPDADLKLTGEYQQYRTYYTMRDGTQAPAVVRQHPDWRVAACLRQAREEGLIQAIGRGRYIHSTGQRELIVACNVPVPGLIVDRLVTMDDILPERRLAMALLQGKGTAPLSAGWLAENVGDEFKNEKAAENWLAIFKPCFLGNKYLYPEKQGLKTEEGGSPDENFKGSFPGYKYLYPGNSTLKFVEYRLAGQRGGKAKRAITKCADLQSAAAALESLMGTPVSAIRFEDEAPAAHPAVIGNLAALSGGYFDASDYEPLNEAEFEDAQDGRWPDTPQWRHYAEWEAAL